MYFIINYLPEEHLRDIFPLADGRMAGPAPLLPGEGQARPRLVLPPRGLLRVRMVQVRESITKHNPSPLIMHGSEDYG